MQISGGEKLTAYLADLGKKTTNAAEVRVGFLEGAVYPDGKSVAMVAALDEFGHGKTPPRPFFRNMVAANAGSWGPMLGTLLAANKGDAALSLSQIGEVIKGELKDSIAAFESPANSPVTNLLKSRFPTGVYKASDVWQAFRDVAKGVGAPAGKPLVWSSHMLNSVDKEVS